MTPSLDPEKHLTVAVEAKGLKFPPFCPKCMQSAKEHVAVEKTIAREDAEPAILGFYPLFCDSCVAIHKRELPHHGIDLFFRRLVKGGSLSAGGAGNGAFALFLTPKMLPGALTPDPWGLLNLLPLAFFYGLSCLCFRAALSQTRYMTVAPPTSVTKTVDFTGDMSEMFEPSWHRFTFENAPYAELFRKANAERIWSKRSEKAQKAASRRSMLTIAFFVTVAAVVIYEIYEDTHEWFEGVFRWIREGK
jgi:hypothetical protein